MPRIQTRLFKLRIDEAGTIRRNDPIIRHAFFKAIKAFLREAQIHIPLWSGMSRGSLIPVARFVNAKDPGNDVLITLSPLKAKSRVPQGMELGTFSFTFAQGTYHFDFEPNVEHFFYGDKTANHPFIPSAPWNSFKQGRAVYQQVLRKELKAVKNPIIIRTLVTRGSKP